MVLIAGGIFIVAAVAGMIWLAGFSSNIVAELAGMAGSVVVAVLIVEGILDRRREEDWALVREQLARAGRGLGQLAAFDLHLALPMEVRRTIPSPAVLPAGSHAQMLDRLAAELDQYVTTYDDDTAHMHPMQLHDTMAPIVWRIRSELGPRVLATGEPRLVHAYGDLDEALGQWDLSRHQLELDKTMLPTMWGDAAAAARGLAGFIRAAEGKPES